MENISLTIPLERNALSAAITMLHTLFNELDAAGPSLAAHEYPAASIEQITQAEIDAGNLDGSAPASEVFGTTPKGDSLFDGKEDPGFAVENGHTIEQPTVGAGAPKPQAAAPTAPTAAAAAPSVATVDLDSEGLPWDIRIGSGNRTKLAKTQQWKLKRLPKEQTQAQWDAYVAEVKAELRAAMAIPGPNVTEQPAAAAASPTPTGTTLAAAPAPAPVVEAPAPAPVAETKYQDANGGEFTEAQLLAAGYKPEQIAALPVVASVATGLAKTFPELMAKITETGTTTEVVNAAVKKHGLSALPLLGARGDLVPAVYAELFGA